MEREKQKKMERERIEQEKKEAEKREQAEKEAMDDMTNDGEPHVPKKSRFDSDDEEDQSSLPPTPVKDRSRSPEQVKRRSPSPQEFKSEEEKQMEFMMKVRKMLTEILLDVTNSEIKSVCKEVYLKEKSRASKGRNDRGLCSLYFMWYLSKGEKTYFGQYDIKTLLYMCQMIHWLNNVNVCLYKLVTVSVAHTSNTLSLKSVEFSQTIEDLIWRMFTLLPLLILSLILNKYICLSTIHVCIVNILARREKLMLKSHG
eukprot:XP_011420834.1 PREDICTED: arginine/serine-rich protein PNISR [Crassostrea gigas]